MADRGVGKSRLEAVQHRLVGDLARQAHIARRDLADRRAHQGAAPMRWRAGQMGDAIAAQAAPGNRAIDSLGIRQDQRGVAHQRPQEDLQAAIAANVIKCAPDRRLRLAGLMAPVRASSVCATILGTPVVPDVNITHSVLRAAACRRTPSAGRRESWSKYVDHVAGPAHGVAVRHQSSIPARLMTSSDVFRLQVRRRDHDAGGDAVQRDQRQRGRKLAVRREQNMGARKVPRFGRERIVP